MSRHQSSSSSSAPLRSSSRHQNNENVAPQRSTSSRKRNSEAVVSVDDEDGDDGNHNDREEVQREEIEKKFDTKRFIFTVQTKEIDSFQALHREVQEQCIKSISRLFLMRGYFLFYMWELFFMHD